MGDSGGGGAVPEEMLREVAVPVLVLDGGDSPAWMRDIAARTAELLPAGTHRTLPGQTHDVAPDALAPVLSEFLTT
ncbi:alpha/beta fold hydrolase [Actinomadura syzygii]|uniref:Alpha/beta hydrolase n=1 Tax=Actinomadura syzygii TaxID=1427538 RepID=A0A5D0UG39_9ACTN|nr:hypothetical protein [Actinomadura syzygii]TYC16622.1 hypothetical protein FXF65_08580 [Actinomadura syzygii]